MEAPFELRAILDSAQQAAAAGDFASAERHLRQAATLQEAQLGPGHLDLANTLNNLGIVCERLAKPADAEAAYRRAYAIATASLAADDPLVLTSGQNLRDFCAATGKPFELPSKSSPTPRPSSAPTAVQPSQPTADSASPSTAAPPAPSKATAPAPPKTASPAPPKAARPLPPKAGPPAQTKAVPPAQTKAAPQPQTKAVPPAPPKAVTPPPPKGGGTRTELFGASGAEVARSAVPAETPVKSSHSGWAMGIGVAGFVLLIALAGWCSRSNVPPAPAAEVSPAPAVEPTAPAAPQPSAPAPEARAPEARAPLEAASAPSLPVVEPAPSRRETSETPAPRRDTPATASLVESRLCRSLSQSNWQCTPATSPTQPGPFFFYTRVKSVRDTVVTHRWFQDGTLRRNAELQVGANPGAGYRTYSRYTVTADQRGNWTIVVQNEEGALLHEETFVVQ